MELKNDVVKSKFESVKEHIIKHRSKYIAGGTLLLGFGLGLYLSNKKYSRNEGPASDQISNMLDVEDLTIRKHALAVEKLDTMLRKKNSAKIIGKFTEIDGEEYEDFSDLRKAKNLIGSTSADVGNVELCYDNDGNTYAVAHAFEAYYGKKPTDTGKF